MGAVAVASPLEDRWEAGRRQSDRIFRGALALTAAGIFTEFDESGAIGRRYRRQDEIGTPFAITVDYQTLEDGTVTVRERDTMAQVRVKRDALPWTIRGLIDGTIAFASLGT